MGRTIKGGKVKSQSPRKAYRNEFNKNAGLTAPSNYDTCN